MIKQLGLDLGSSYTRIYDRSAETGKNPALCLPTLAVTDTKTGKTVAIGNEAKAMAGKTPSELRVCRPVIGGGISEPEAAVRMLHSYFSKLNAVSFVQRPNVVLSVGSGLTEVEKRATEDALYDAGARKVYTVESPIAGALGAGVRINTPGGHMIVDLGGGSTEVSVISMGNIVAGEAIRIGGADLSCDIIEYMKNKYGVGIGMPAAEALKIKLGTVSEGYERGTAVVPGKDLGGGIIGKAKISSSDLLAAMDDGVGEIIALIKRVYDGLRPEMAADICNEGIILIGGGALLDGLPDRIFRGLGIRAMVVQNPSACVCIGAGKCFDSKTASKYLHETV